MKLTKVFRMRVNISFVSTAISFAFAQKCNYKSKKERFITKHNQIRYSNSEAKCKIEDNNIQIFYGKWISIPFLCDSYDFILKSHFLLWPVTLLVHFRAEMQILWFQHALMHNFKIKFLETSRIHVQINR